MKKVCENVQFTERCVDVPAMECSDQPQESCETVMEKQCSTKEVKECSNVPSMTCDDTPRQVCLQVPRQSCQDVEDCKNVPKVGKSVLPSPSRPLFPFNARRAVTRFLR